MTDFDFSPFDDYLLSTASQDGSVSSVDSFCLSQLNNFDHIIIDVLKKMLRAWFLCSLGCWLCAKAHLPFVFYEFYKRYVGGMRSVVHSSPSVPHLGNRGCLSVHVRGTSCRPASSFAVGNGWPIHFCWLRRVLDYADIFDNACIEFEFDALTNWKREEVTWLLGRSTTPFIKQAAA